MTSDALPATRNLPSAPMRIVPWALIGAVGGFLVGFLMSSYVCHAYAGLEYDCHPTQELKIGLLTAAGLVAGLLASRLRRSMRDRQKTLMTVAILILLVVLVVACYDRVNPPSCGGDAFHTSPPCPSTQVTSARRPAKRILFVP